MNKRPRCFKAFALALGVAILTFSGFALADPPSRVARLGYMSGAVSFSPGGEDAWVQASLNRPLTTGDRLWADANSRAEVQVGGAAIRMSATTDLSVLNLDDQIAQLQLTQGTLNVHVRRFDTNQSLEVDTPNLAFTFRQPGAYRIDVDPNGNATSIYVREGQGEVYGEGAAYVIDASQPYRFTGTNLQEYQNVGMPAPDDFDRWSAERDHAYDSSASLRYVSQDVVGYQDLDAYGSWRADPTYGNVWVPAHVSAGWAPYHDGHWAWVDPWGWTWVDDAPWGFAVSHYGRWASVSGSWCWVPGPVQTRAYYAPALVAFVGGANFTLAVSSGPVGGVAWFPLGPREVYRPSYTVSRGYFENINRSNTVVNTTVINNYYNNTNVTNVTYINRNVPGAVVAVPRTAFEQAQPVAKVAVRVEQDKMVDRSVAIAPSIAPTERSVRGAAAEGHKPPAEAIQRAVVARETPPARASFAEQRQKLEANAGKPLAEDARKELKQEPAAPKPAVKVIAKREEAPTKPPPAAQARPGAPANENKSADAERKADENKRVDEAKKADENKKADERNEPRPPAVANTPRPPQAAEPKQPAPPAQARQPEEQDRNARQADKAEPRKEAATPPKPDQRANVEQPGKEAATPPKPDQRANVEQPRKEAPREAPPVPTPQQPQAARPTARPPAPPVQAARPPAPQERRGPEERDTEAQRAQPAPKPAAPPPQARVNPPNAEAASPRTLPQPRNPEPPPAAREQVPPRPVAQAPRPPQPAPAPRAEQPRKPAPNQANEGKKNEPPRDEDKRDRP